MLSYAKEWFVLAKEKETETEKVSFGLALVFVKQLNFESALREIDELIQKLEREGRKKEMTYYYLRALCYKKLGEFERARADYEYLSCYPGSSPISASPPTTTVSPTSCSRWSSPRAGAVRRSSTASPT